MKDEVIEMIISHDTKPENHSMTTRNFIISLTVSFTLCIICALIFSALRKRIRSVYEPRTFIVAKHLRMDATSNSFLGWIYSTWKTPLSEVTRMVGLDGYFFLRYIILTILLCLILAVPFAAVLIPLHVTGGNSIHATSFLELVASSNISEKNKTRHLAHVILCGFGTSVALILFHYELNQYFRIRGKYILSHDEIPGSTSTLLIKGLKPEFLHQENLVKYFSGLSPHDRSAIKRVWYNRDFSSLKKLIDNRKRILNKLELEELWLVERCLGVGDFPSKTGNSSGPNSPSSSPSSSGPSSPNSPNSLESPESPETPTTPNSDTFKITYGKDSSIIGNLWRDYLHSTDLELMKGKKGTLFTWLKGELSRLNAQVSITQNKRDTLPSISSCFVQFNDKLSCFIASRSLGVGDTSSPGSHVFDKIHPADVVWNNLTVAGYSQMLLHGIASFLNYLFIFGWTFPVALVSMFTQIELMSQWMPQVEWLVRIPQASNVLSNMIAPLIVSALTSQVPGIFKALARIKGYPTNTLVEMDVQKHLFLFMFFQLFVIATLATGLPSFLYKVMVNTSEGAITLASSLPKASTFFISFVMASSMTTSGNVLMQSSHLCTHFWLKYTAKTPRSKFHAIYEYAKPNWGSIYPLATNIGAIGIAYALISPLILPSAILGLGTMFIAFKYCILYCYVPRCMADGDYYPRAMFQLFSGVYCQQIALLGTLLVSQQPLLAGVTVMISIVTGIAHFRLKQRSVDMKSRIPLDSDYSSDLSPELDDAEKQRKPRHNEGLRTVPLPSNPDINRYRGNYSRSANQLPADLSYPQSPSIALTPSSMGSPNTPNTPSTPSTPNTPNSMYSGSSDRTLVSHYGAVTPQAEMMAVNMDLFDAFVLDYDSLNFTQKSYIANQIFVHPLCRVPRPCVWLPNDCKGIAADQVREMQTLFTDLRASCNGVEITEDGTLLISTPPPDMDIRFQ